MTIKGSKSKVLSKSVSKMVVFREYKGQNIKYIRHDPKKALRHPERRLLTYFA